MAAGGGGEKEEGGGNPGGLSCIELVITVGSGQVCHHLTHCLLPQLGHQLKKDEFVGQLVFPAMFVACGLAGTLQWQLLVMQIVMDFRTLLPSNKQSEARDVRGPLILVQTGALGERVGGGCWVTFRAGRGSKRGEEG